MMAYTQPASYYYDHSSSGSKYTQSQNHNRDSSRYYESPATASSQNFPLSGSKTNPRTLPPYISVQRPSEPASPATIATTLSSHSTPSPSPSRASNMPATSSSADFTLFDDAVMAAAQDLTATSGKGRTVLDVATSVSESNPNLNHYTTSGFPIIVPSDASYSNYTPSGLYGSYASNYSTADANAGLYSIPSNSQQQLSHTPSQSSKYLRPTMSSPAYRDSQNGTRTPNLPIQVDDVEAIENVPALSPTSRHRRTGSSNVNGSKSPQAAFRRPQNMTTSHHNNQYAAPTANYLHSAMPKLGRTFSDAVQDELYVPDLASHSDGKHFSAKHGASDSKPLSYATNFGDVDSKHSFPQIFHEAQQQHQQDFSHMHRQHHSVNRDRSPFRHNSPFHPTNTTYNVAYGPGDAALNQGNVNQGLDQNQQLAMALALREQMKNNAEHSVAPKTISPRDSLLEYHEPDNHHGQMSLFPPLPSGRLVSSNDETMSNASIQASSSHDGSDMDDFHSMATSRRASMANSSVSSHLEMPRFGYMQQASSYDNLPSAQYYYSDPAVLANAINSDSSAPYIKEEMDYNPIPRPSDTSANTGTYTCTYSGCGQRFTTSTKLQKHRREAHRKAVPMGNSVSTAAAIASRNAQPGPHRCMRTNPSTGKPCNTVFSRPYDLTRHEDTIHNSAKEKVRCEICNDEKTFSRPDALVRHRRVKHGIH